MTGFALRGYEATSLDSLAGELGVRKQTILYYFPSKAELLRGVILYATAELRRGARPAPRPPTAALASAPSSTACSGSAPAGRSSSCCFVR